MQGLGSNFIRGSHQICSVKIECSLKFCNILRKTPVPFFLCEPLYKLQLYSKIDSGTKFSCDFCKIFKNAFLQNTCGWMLVCLQQLLALYFAIIYGWQLSSSERSLAGKEIIHIFQGFYRFRFIFFHFFHFCLDKYMFTLSVT